jgi:putative membrane protein
MLQAAQGGTFLMQTAQLGQQRARSAPLREFCGFEVSEQQGIMQAMGLLTGGSLPMPGPTQQQAATLAQLQAASAGPNFDRLLVEAQLNGHRDALGTYNAIMQNTGEPAGMRALAIAAVGHIREHIAVLERGLVRGRV